MKLYVILLSLVMTFAEVTAINKYHIIPYPAELTEKTGKFTLPKKLYICLPDDNEYIDVMTPFIQTLEEVGSVKSYLNKKKKVQFKIISNDIIVAEGYKLIIDKKGIIIEVSTPTGLFYSLQTIKQLMPEEIFGKNKSNAALEIPCVEINDYPQFSYRGAHLDVSRHYMPIDFIYKYIDLLSIYKFNRFHWHLTDDQGWRIEIKKYPLLTEIGSVRKETVIGHKNDTPRIYDGKTHQGFYTQEEIKKIITFAQKRFITIIPEIEMPGHASAALAAYPELSCGLKERYEVATSWGIFEDVFCTKESTFKFLEDVLDEVISLFPSEYIHIGGDECPKTSWKQCGHCQSLIKEKGLKDEDHLQSYFIHRIEQFVNSRGRKIIGWDEILDGGLAPNATVMSWRGEIGGIEAANHGNNVIMCPHKFCYLDYYQEPREQAPLAIGGNNPLSNVYALKPVPAVLPADKHHYIQGIQANVWTEYMPTPEHVEYMAFPRITAIAEVAWTPESNRSWEDYLKRLQTDFGRLRLMNVNACQHEKIKD